MTAVTLTAGDYFGAFQGYSRSGGSFAVAFGSISAQPLAGQTIDLLATGSGLDSLYMVGDTTGLGALTLTVNGVGWTVGTGTYDTVSVTTYPITPSGGGFANGVAYTVDLTAGGGGPDVTAPTITSSASPSNTENTVLAHALTADEAVTWSIVGGADQAKFEISGSTLRWASNGTKDYEAPDDADTNNTYVVDVRATDGASNTTDQTITVTVGNGFDGPTWGGKSTALGSTSSGTINFTSSGRASGDRLYIAIASANEAIATPTGFTEEATVSPQSRGTAAAAGGIRGALFWKDSDGTETTVSIADPGNHVYAQGFVVRPASGQTIATHVSAGKNAAASTSHSGNGLTTTDDDCLVLDVWYTDRDSAGPSYSGEANASLVNLTERHDAGTTSSAGSGIVIYSGERQAAGSVSATTATSAASVAWCAITLALKNATGGIGGGLTVTESDDTVSASSALTLKGAASPTEASDTLAASGAVTIAATLTATEGDDTLAADGAGLTPITGAASITEVDDTLTAAAAMVIAATASITEAGDTVTSTSTLLISAGVTINEADDSVSSAATLSLAGLVNTSEGGDTASGLGNLPVVGALSRTEGDDTIAAAGALTISGAASITEAGDTIVAFSAQSNTGTASLTEADDTVASASTLAVRASLATTEGSDSLSATASAVTRGTASIVEEMDTSAATSVLTVSALVAANDDDDTMIATARLTLVASASITEAGDFATITVERPWRQYPLAGQGQGYPGVSASYPMSGAQPYPGNPDQTYPLSGQAQAYPRRAA